MLRKKGVFGDGPKNDAETLNRILSSIGIT